jgi:hypothetical protein
MGGQQESGRVRVVVQSGGERAVVVVMVAARVRVRAMVGLSMMVMVVVVVVGSSGLFFVFRRWRSGGRGIVGDSGVMFYTLLWVGCTIQLRFSSFLAGFGRWFGGMLG